MMLLSFHPDQERKNIECFWVKGAPPSENHSKTKSVRSHILLIKFRSPHMLLLLFLWLFLLWLQIYIETEKEYFLGRSPAAIQHWHNSIAARSGRPWTMTMAILVILACVRARVSYFPLPPLRISVMGRCKKGRGTGGSIRYAPYFRYTRIRYAWELQPKK